MRLGKIAVALLAFLLSKGSHAETRLAPTEERTYPQGFNIERADLVQNQSLWSSQVHLGYAVQTHSNTGFGNSGGSLAFFDFSRRINDSLLLGMRTSSSGSTNPQLSFYRLGAGPVLMVKASDNLQIHTSFSYFKESALTKDKSKAYQSHGFEWMGGVNRVVPLLAGSWFSYGAFISRHQGSLQQQLAASTLTYAFETKNVGVARGVEISLLVDL